MDHTASAMQETHAAECGRVNAALRGAHHLIDLCGVELLNIPEDSDVIAAHKVDGHTLAPISA